MTTLRAVLLTGLLLAGGAASQASKSEQDSFETAAETTTETGAPTALVGTWEASETRKERDARFASIDEATEDLGRMRRGRARDRLMEQTTPIERMHIEIVGDRVMLTVGLRNMELRLGGDPIEIEGLNGPASATARIEEDTLVIETRAEFASWRATYRSDGETLTVSVMMTSERISNPVEFVTTYVRVDS